MNELTSRFCEYEKDRDRLINFLLDYRAAVDVRQYPTIWRVRLLLTSRVWEPEKDTRIWQNESGQIVAFAMLWRRSDSPYLVFDSFIHPEFVTQELLLVMFEWGHERAAEIGLEQSQAVTVFANGFNHDVFVGQLQTGFGYTREALNPDVHNVYLSKSLEQELLTPSLPEGYTIQRLQDMNGLEQYQSLYSFARVNPAFEKELIESDEYSHLIVVDPAGEFAAYCECSISRAEWERTGRRIGWIDYVGTKPDFQRRGIGEAALWSGLRQLRDWGADRAMLITISTNAPALKLYNRTGFEAVQLTESPAYKKQILLR